MVVSETADHFFQVSYNPTLRTGRNVRANRVGAANALKNKKIKGLLSYFRGSVTLSTLERSRTGDIKRIIRQLDPATRY